MNCRLSVALLAVLSATAICVCAQGTFQNLDFEAAQIVYVDSFHADIVSSNALPGWSAFAGTNQLSILQFGLLGAFYPVQLLAQTNGGSISGNFSLLLSWLGSRPDGSISQTGVVPADAQSLFFKSGTQPPLVSLGGQSLLLTTVSTDPNYILYGAEISGFAGQTSPLVFAAEFNAISWLDDIQFSSQPIPEPSAAVLLALSTLIFAARRIRGRRGTP